MIIAPQRKTSIPHPAERGATKLPHAVLTDRRLSDEARGLLIYMLSKPRGWVFTIGRIARHKRIGESRVRRALKELEEAGYVEREVVRKGGRVRGFAVRWNLPGGRFVLLPNRFVHRLSLRALGVLGVIAAAPPGWTWRGDRLMRATGLGAHALRQAIHELEEAGAIKRVRVRVAGRFAGWWIHAVGVPKPGSPHAKKPQAEKPHAENGQAENGPKITSLTAKAPPPKQEVSKQEPASTTGTRSTEGKKEDATLSVRGVNPPDIPPDSRSIRAGLENGGEAVAPPSPGGKKSSKKTEAGKQTPDLSGGERSKGQDSSTGPTGRKRRSGGAARRSPAYEAAQQLNMPDKHRRRWMGIARNKLSRGAANGIAQRWPELIPALMNLSFAARLTAHTTAIWTQDVYRAAKEHGPEKVRAALEKAARSRDPLTTFKRALDEEPFEPMNEPAPIDQNLWKILVLHLEDMNGPLTRAQVQVLFGKMREWIERHGLEATEEAVRTAIQRGWRNIYEPKPRKGAREQREEKPAVPRLEEEHPIFGHLDPWNYPWPESFVRAVGKPPSPNDYDACSRWFWDVSEAALYPEYRGVDERDAERVRRDWGFKL